jgi:hypothetical protein
MAKTRIPQEELTLAEIDKFIEFYTEKIIYYHIRNYPSLVPIRARLAQSTSTHYISLRYI